MADAASHTPDITFAIPYYANKRYLAEAIQSVRDQTFDRWELIVIDDAGPEPADDLVANLGDSRARYVRNSSNLGLAGNWNKCVGTAAAPLVTLLHSDDRLLPSYAASVIAAANRDPGVAAVFTDAVIIGETGRRVPSLTDFVKRFARRPRGDHDVVGDAGLAAILGNNYVMCPTLCYRRSIVGDAPFDERWRFTLDIDHVSRLLLRGQRLRGVRANLYEYRRHALNQTTSLTADATRFEEEIAFYREVESAALAAGFTRTAATAHRRAMVRVHLIVRIVHDLVRLRLAAAETKRVMLWADLRGRPLASTPRTAETGRAPH